MREKAQPGLGPGVKANSYRLLVHDSFSLRPNASSFRVWVLIYQCLTQPPLKEQTQTVAGREDVELRQFVNFVPLVGCRCQPPVGPLSRRSCPDLSDKNTDSAQNGSLCREHFLSLASPNVHSVKVHAVREQLEISSKIRTALTSGEGVAPFPFCLFVADTGLAA